MIPYNCAETCPENIASPELKSLKLVNLNIEELNMVNNKLDQHSRDRYEMINQPLATKTYIFYIYNDSSHINNHCGVHCS